jgi:hypothetical protein
MPNQFAALRMGRPFPASVGERKGGDLFVIATTVGEICV